MKVVLVICALVMSLVLASPALSRSTEYSGMPTNQLYDLVQHIGDVPTLDWPVLAGEWDKRVAEMTPEEKERYGLPHPRKPVQEKKYG